jgi:hypothetical protein
MYQLDNNDNVAYTKYQLMEIKGEEKKPDKSIQKQQYAQKITNKKMIKGKLHYEVLWEDKTKSFEPYQTLKNEIPDLIKDYNKSNKSS